MSYTVLARKWRPKKFAELVGQQHVMQALANALDQNRLHHAYLFTGTRGVGKTTIARIFAKALNCEHGISSTPCGVCDNCRAIDEGKFIDLIEVDAASKTKVDDTREILDNVQFAATQGRFKVYLIDEVHMLSKSSFNALLKTLEEPPEHVKFILATTDPHKLPITVLSRCLQFNLMRLTVEQIQNHLAYVLSQEALSFDESALGLIAKSADGSARDALSLLDQAIAYGGGAIEFEAVQTMLGLVDQQFTIRVIQALANYASDDLKAVIMDIGAMGVDYQALLTQLIEALHAISYKQVFQDMTLNSGLPNETLNAFAESLTADRVQMLYQIALLTKQDMLLSPDIRIGFEMGLMRMLAFLPKSEQAAQIPAGKESSHSILASQKSSMSPNLNFGSDSGASARQQPPIATPEKPSANVHQNVQNLTGSMVQSQARNLQQNPPVQNVNPAKNTNDSSSGSSSSFNSVDSGLSSEIRPDESPMMQDMGINDAMSHLSSARSLVSGGAKKKDEVRVESDAHQTSVEEVPHSQPVNHSEMLQARLQALQTTEPMEQDKSADADNANDSKRAVDLNELNEPNMSHSSLEANPSSHGMPQDFQHKNVDLSNPLDSAPVNKTDLPKTDLPWEGESQFSTNAAESHYVNSLENQPPSEVVEHSSDRVYSPDGVSNGVLDSTVSEQMTQIDDSQEFLQAEAHSPETPSNFYDVPWAESADNTEVLAEVNRPVAKDSKDSFETRIESIQETQEVQEIQDRAIETNSMVTTEINSAVENTEFNDLSASKNRQKPSKSLAQWMEWIEALEFSGMQREVALNSILLPAGENFNLALMPEHDYPHVNSVKQEIASAVSQYCQQTVEWQAWPAEQEGGLQTPSQFLESQAQQKLEETKHSLLSDSVFQQLVETLDMQVLENTFSVKE